MGVKPAVASSSMTAPGSTGSTVSTSPAPSVATASPWQGAGIFFYPFLLICLAFGIAMYTSGGKTA
jgi:hypothetical protein